MKKILKTKNYLLKSNQANEASEANQANQKGSALVLMIIVMVTALFIVASISAVSIIESKMSQKTRYSTPALQKADSGLEIVLGYVNNNSPTDIDSICDNLGYHAAWVSDHCELDLNDDSEEDIRIYFINDVINIITSSSTSFGDVEAIRSVGIEKINDDDYVTRALQTDVNASP